MREITRIHLVGIGGVGMGGIAEVLLNLGYEVQGSDLRESRVTARLAARGANIFLGHDATHIQGADVVVVSTAIDTGNPETDAAREQRIPVVRRAEMLAELMRFRHGIAIAGTHGKTTVTSLVASVLAEAGEDPTFVIGGRLVSADSNARLGAGKYLVAEADESDASFTHLQPMIAVVTNIDFDHMETYDGDPDRLYASFEEFVHNLPFYGLAILCSDDAGVQHILPQLKRTTLTYGVDEGADIRAVEVSRTGTTSFIKVARPGHENLLQLELSMPGHHNVLNSLAAVAVAHELELDDAALQTALLHFEGIDRRLQVVGEHMISTRRVLFIDDYAHHPTEIAATLDAVRQGWPGRRVVVVFQPHRYSRTRDLMDDFAEVLTGADRLFIAEVHAAGEQPIAGADGRSICRAVRTRGQVEPVFVPDLSHVADDLSAVLEDGDLVLTLGAGSIGAIAQELPARLGGQKVAAR
ncbi:MAG: UDP-N-acetylmuramate--L-alanine ligase [Gammaproteobacteria bacterium]|nr:UDP-N-acetylmuramate--L-alanine ligase [Gammaproteobacteria bacterium]